MAKQTGLPIGLHFNITEGTPISKPTLVSTLIDPKTQNFLGKPKFWSIATENQQYFNQLHVERELESQIVKFKELTGNYPKFIDSHNHAHVATENITKAFCKISQKYNIERTRLPIQIRFPESFHNNNFHHLVSDCSIQVKKLIENSFLVVPKFLGMHLMGKDLNLSRLRKTLSSMNDCSGKLELMVHPGYKTERKGGCTNSGDDFDEFSKSEEREIEMEQLVEINKCFSCIKPLIK